MNAQDYKNMRKLDNVTTAELTKLSGTGAILASGTQSATIADIATDASGTEISVAVNALIAAVLAFEVIAAGS
jgi:hypothetical protein